MGRIRPMSGPARLPRFAVSRPPSRPRIRRPACRRCCRRRRKGRIVLLAAGKAAGSMAEVAEQHLSRRAQGLRRSGSTGIAVARHGYGRPTRVVDDDRGRPSDPRRGRARRGRARARASPTPPTRDDLVLVLMSGGASANWIAPAAGITLRRQAGGDARAAALRRAHRRDQHACASTSRASRAGGWRGTPSRRGSSPSPSPTCRATTRR